MTLVLRYSARSDRGLVRQNNQDAVYAGPRLLALADGMGGHAAGEVASSLVISALAPLDEDDPGDDLLAELREATVEGNAAITRHVADSPDLEGMGTTLTAILFAGSRLGLVHIGDSRAYQLRDGALSQITKDDTFVQSLIDEGRITEEEAHTHPQRSLLLRAITGQDIEPSLTMREARPGDRYLLCSDGLSGVVSDETLAETLTSYRDPRECADRMIELALRGGGPDNITCIVADVVDIDFGDDAPIIGGSVGDGRDEAPPPRLGRRTRLGHHDDPRPAPRRARRPRSPSRRKRPRGLRILAVALGGRWSCSPRRARWPGCGCCSSTTSASTAPRSRSSKASRARCSGSRCTTSSSTPTSPSTTSCPERPQPGGDGILPPRGPRRRPHRRAAAARPACSSPVPSSPPPPSPRPPAAAPAAPAPARLRLPTRPAADPPPSPPPRCHRSRASRA